MPRLCETWTAATNCPRFLKPEAAVCRLVPGGSRPCSLLASLVLDASLVETELWVEPWPEEWSASDLPCVSDELSLPCIEDELPCVPPAGEPPPCPCCA